MRSTSSPRADSMMMEGVPGPLRARAATVRPRRQHDIEQQQVDRVSGKVALHRRAVATPAAS